VSASQRWRASNASAVDEGERNLGDRLVGLPGCAQSMWSRMRFGFRPAIPTTFGFIIS
jgi:hypothetical protein